MNMKPVCMCCVVKINKKHNVCLTNFRILLILSHVCESYIYISKYKNTFIFHKYFGCFQNLLQCVKVLKTTEIFVKN